jgi:hypothetical protein
LNGFSHREVEAVNFLPSDEAGPSDSMGAITPAAVLDEEYFLPQTLVGVDAEKGLTDSDKDRQMQDGVWRQLLELNAVGK